MQIIKFGIKFKRLILYIENSVMQLNYIEIARANLRSLRKRMVCENFDKLRLSTQSEY